MSQGLVVVYDGCWKLQGLTGKFPQGQNKVARFRNWQGNVGIGQVFFGEARCIE